MLCNNLKCSPFLNYPDSGSYMIPGPKNMLGPPLDWCGAGPRYTTIWSAMLPNWILATFSTVAEVKHAINSGKYCSSSFGVMLKACDDWLFFLANRGGYL